MKDLKRCVELELRRLQAAPSPNAKPSGAGTVRFVARCPVGAEDVLSKVTSLLRLMDEVALKGWLADEQWATTLPAWFTASCVAPMTKEQAELWLVAWKKLPPEEQQKAELEKDWSLDDWLYWMTPENRQWFWWDGRVLEDCDHIALAVEVEAWPFPWGSLRWLFKAAGASALELEVQSVTRSGAVLVSPNMLEKPHDGEIEEAKGCPNGWVYRIAGKFGADENVPPEAIIGAWKVDAQGKIVGAFVKNPKYDCQRWPARKLMAE